MPGPLDGVSVIEIAQEIQGPYAGLFLADMGADVIKIEMREVGDLSRFLVVQLVAGAEAHNANFSPYFLAMNRGKRSLTLDLKTPEAKEILARLLDSADVLLSNYRPGVLDRLGFGYEALSKRNPRLIYALGSSWGPRGPWVTRPSGTRSPRPRAVSWQKTGCRRIARSPAEPWSPITLGRLC